MDKFAHSRLLCSPFWMRIGFVRAAACCVVLSLFISGCLPTPLLAFSPRPSATSISLPTTVPSTSPVTPVPTHDPLLGTPAPSPTTSVLQHLTSNSLRGLKISFWYPWGGAAENDIQALITEFNARNEWGIQVINTSQGSLSELAHSLDDVKTLPDIVAIDPAQSLDWQAKSQVLTDLNPYIVNPMWGITANDLQDFTKVFLDETQVAGQQLGFPAQQSLLFFIYNTTWATELGFKSPPTTLDEFRQQACAAAKANTVTNDTTRPGTGGWLVNSDALTMLGWVQVFGGSFAPDANGRYHFNTLQAQNAFTYLDALYSAGCAWNGRNPTPIDYFAGRYALFITATMEDLPGLAATMQRLKNSDQWAVMAFPSLTGKPLTVTYGTSYSIFKSTPARQLAAWLLIRWLTAPEQDSRLARGWSTYPVRTTSQNLLSNLKLTLPQWETVLPLLTSAIPEPSQPSWLVASAIIQDGSAQLYTSETRPETIQPILGQMDSLAAEVIKQP